MWFLAHALAFRRCVKELLVFHWAHLIFHLLLLPFFGLLIVEHLRRPLYASDRLPTTTFQKTLIDEKCPLDSGTFQKTLIDEKCPLESGNFQKTLIDEMLVTAAVEIEVTAFIKDELPRLHRRRSVGGWLRRPALACMALCSAAAAAPLRVPLVPGHAGSSRRIGEARHPGPRRARRADPIDVEDRQFTVASWNPGSLHAAAQAVSLSWSVDVIAFQESRLDLQGQRRVALDSDGSWSFAFGPARQPQLDARGHKFVPQGGVAIAARRPASIAVEPPLNPAEDLLWHTGRWVATVVPVLSGAWQLAVHNYYGVSGASMDHVAAAANERNLALLFLAASARDVPTVIVMDGNVNPGHSAAIQAALQTGEWVDVAHAWRDRDPSVYVATYNGSCCFSSEPNADLEPDSRIDSIFVNRRLWPLVAGFEVATHIAQDTHQHVPLFLKLDIPPLSLRGSVLCIPEALDLDDVPLSAKDPCPYAELLWKFFESDFRRALDAGRSDAAFAAWSDFAVAYLCDRGAFTRSGRDTTRGRPPEVRDEVRVASRGVPKAGPCTPKARRLYKLQRQLVHLGRLLASVERFSTEAKRDSVRVLWHSLLPEARRFCPNAMWVLDEPPDDAAAAAAALRDVEALLHASVTERSRVALAEWRARLRRSWSEHGREAYQWLRGPRPAPTVRVQRDDGSWTYAPDEMLGLATSAWSSVFNLYDGAAPPPEPSWADFFAEYQVEIEAAEHRVAFDKLNGMALWQTLHAKSDYTCPGSDGWRMAELRRLPPAALEPLAQLLRVIEDDDLNWPSAMLFGVMPLLPKGKGYAPLDMRPITVTSACYSLWASTRFRHSREWQREVLPADSYGGRESRTASEMYFECSLAIERAHHLGPDEQLLLLFLDRVKCFDRLLPELVCSLLQALGFPQGITRAMKRFYEGALRAFRIGPWLGEWFRSLNSMLQGCALTVVGANAMFSVWLRRLTNAVPDVRGSAFLDDAFLRSRTADWRSMVRALDVCARFDALSGQALNADKTEATGTSDAAREKMHQLAPAGTKKVSRTRSLGVDMIMDRRRIVPVSAKRVADAKTSYSRLAMIPLPREARVRLAMQAVTPQWSWGVELVQPRKGDLEALRQLMWSAVWGRQRAMACKEFVLAYFWKGHVLDPVQASDYLALVQQRRLLTMHPQLRDLYFEVWHARRGCASKLAVGPVARMERLCAELGLQWPSPEVLVDATGQRILWLSGERGLVLHQFRDLVRAAQIRAAAVRRQGRGREDMPDISARPIDAFATMLLTRRRTPTEASRNILIEAATYFGRDFTKYDLGCLGSILSGAYRSNLRLSKFVPDLSADCPFCPVHEDNRHLFLECPHHDRMREPFAATLRAWAYNHSVTTSHTGIAHLPAWVDDELEALDRIPEPDLDISRPLTAAELQPGNTWYDEDGSVLVFSDGASSRQEDVLWRRAGYGLWWGRAHPANLSLPVPGRVQTNQIAELLAIRAACRRRWAKTRVCSDSEYCVKGFRKLLLVTDAELACWDHADIWREIRAHVQATLDASGALTLTLRWVKAHVDYSEVLVGRRDYRDYEGNRRADALAVAGAQQHSLQDATVEEYYHHVRAVVLTQTMFLKVLLHRISEEPSEDHRPFHDEDGDDDPPAGSGEGAVAPRAWFEGLDGDSPTDSASSSAATAAPVILRRGRAFHRHRRRFDDRASVAPAAASYTTSSDSTLTPEQLFPTFPWINVAVGEAFGLPPVPALDLTQQQWHYPRAWLAALHWYFHGRRWDLSGEVSWLELGLDMWAATGLEFHHSGSTSAAHSLGDVATVAAAMARQYVRLTKHAVAPVPEVISQGPTRLAGLSKLGLPRGATGFLARPHFTCWNFVRHVLFQRALTWQAPAPTAGPRGAGRPVSAWAWTVPRDRLPAPLWDPEFTWQGDLSGVSREPRAVLERRRLLQDHNALALLKGWHRFPEPSVHDALAGLLQTGTLVLRCLGPGCSFECTWNTRLLAWTGQCTARVSSQPRRVAVDDAAAPPRRRRRCKGPALPCPTAPAVVPPLDAPPATPAVDPVELARGHELLEARRAKERAKVVSKRARGVALKSKEAEERNEAKRKTNRQAKRRDVALGLGLPADATQWECVREQRRQRHNATAEGLQRHVIAPYGRITGDQKKHRITCEQCADTATLQHVNSFMRNICGRCRAADVRFDGSSAKRPRLMRTLLKRPAAPIPAAPPAARRRLR